MGFIHQDDAESLLVQGLQQGACVRREQPVSQYSHFTGADAPTKQQIQMCNNIHNKIYMVLF